MPIADLNDFRQKLTALQTIDLAAAQAATERDSMLTKPPGALGRLEEIAIWASGWQRKHPPTLVKPQVIVFAGNHGVCAQGVSAFPPEVTVQMVANFENGGAAINQLAKAFGASFSVHPINLNHPTQDFTKAPAMTEAECIAALNVGWNAVSDTSDMLIIGEMGIGNTTIAAALSAALFGGDGKDWAGPGTGVSAEGLSLKARVINDGLKKHSQFLGDPASILQHLGGFELAAMTGAILAARIKSIPVILDGFVTCAAAAILAKINSSALDHCISGHVSAEPGHILLLNHLGLDPLLNLGMRLGEGSGAALALGIVKGALATHTGMASFAEAGVSDGD